MDRRAFLWCVSAGAAGAGGTAWGRLPTHARRAAATGWSKLSRIAISTSSLRSLFGADGADGSLPAASRVALLDVPDLLVERYQVRHFEFCSTHFGSIEPTYLQELRYTLVRTGSSVVNVPVDIEECGRDGTFSSSDPQERKAALDAVKQWVDVAHALGARSVRVGPGSVDPDDLSRTAAAYRALAAYSLAKGVQVVVENHGDFGTVKPEQLVKLFRLVGPGRIGALPDFANFADEPTRQRGLEMLFPFAPFLCHASGLRFDAEGMETEYDFPGAMDIAKKAAFRGIYSIEFEGRGDPYAGIQKTLDELVRYL